MAILQINSTEAPKIQEMFDKSVQELCSFFELQWNQNLPKLFLIQDEGAIQELWNGNIGDTVSGWVDNLNVYIIDREHFKKGNGEYYSDEEYCRLIKHELSHAFTQVYTDIYNSPIKPDWLWEGIAIFLSGEADLLPSKEEFVNFLDYYDRDMQSSVVYEESGIAIKYLVDSYGKEKLLLLLKDLKEITTKADFEKLFKRIYVGRCFD